MHNIDLLNELLGTPSIDSKSIKDSRKELEKESKALESLRNKIDKKKEKLQREETQLIDKWQSRFTRVRESCLKDIENLKSQAEQIKIDTTKKHEESLLQMQNTFSNKLGTLSDKLKHLGTFDMELTDHKFELDLPSLDFTGFIVDIISSFKSDGALLQELQHGDFYTRANYVYGLITGPSGWKGDLNSLVKYHKDKGCNNLEALVLAIFEGSPIGNIDTLRPIITEHIINETCRFPEPRPTPHPKFDKLLDLLTKMYVDSDDYTFEIDDSAGGRTLFMDYHGKNMSNNYQTLGDNTLFKFFPGGPEHIWLHCPSVQKNQVQCGKTGEHRLNSVDAILTKVIMYMGFMREAKFI